MSISSFNGDAQRLYERLGYKVIGELKDYIVAGHSVDKISSRTEGHVEAGSSMKESAFFCWLIILILLALGGCQRYDQPELRRELLAMLEIDQRIREEHLVVMTTATPPDEVFVPQEALDKASQALFDQMKEIDEAHTARLKEIVAQYGWPGYSLVGEDGSDAAWVLVQHSGDLAFQKRCLDLLTAAAGEGEADPRHVAYLTDRVLVAEGKPQLYGTQFKPEGGRMVPFPIQDEDGVDQRREEVGLSPLEEYSRQMNEHLERGQ